MNWLDCVDEKDMIKFAQVNFNIVKFENVKKATHPKYGAYFTFCGWDEEGNYINPIYLGQYGPIYSNGGYAEPMDNLQENVFDDFNALIHATGDVRQVYIKWIEMVAGANETEYDENDNSYIEALEDGTSAYIRQVKQELLAQMDKTVSEEKYYAADFLGDLEVMGLYDIELDNGEWDRPNWFGKRNTEAQDLGDNAPIK